MGQPHMRRAVFFFCALIWSVPSALANFAYFFGSGIATVGKAGVMDVLHNDFQGYNNPGFASFAQPSFGFAVVMNKLDVAPLKNILLKHPNFPHGEDVPDQGDLRFPEPLLSGVQLSFTLPFLTQFEKQKLRFHSSAFIPFGESVYLGTKSTYIPSYVFYEGRNRHLDSHFSLSAQIIPDVLGIGAGLTLSLKAVSHMSLIMDASTNQVTTDAKTRVVPGFSYFAGVYVRPAHWLHVSVAGYTQESWGFEFSADSNAVVWENANVGIQVMGQSTFNFLPPRGVMSVSLALSDRFTLTPQIEYHGWSLYKTHRIQVSLPETGLTPAFPVAETRDIWVPRLGMTWQASRWLTLHTGAAYMPTPIVNLSEAHNDIDADRVIAGVGIELDGGRDFLGMDGVGMRWGIFGQMHYLIPRTVIKTADVIGSPGYTLKGISYVAGLHLAFDT